MRLKRSEFGLFSGLPNHAWPSENKDEVYKYTAKRKSRAVISNGTAVLGFKTSVLKLVNHDGREGFAFKIYADIDVFDIEIDKTDPDKVVDTIKAIALRLVESTWRISKHPNAFI